MTVGALPAAANDSTVQYVALGDSYAAGQGGGLYLNSCLQTAESYPALLDAEKRIHLRANEACSGAETSEVAATQLNALNRGTRLVTLTVGAADLDLSRVLTACTAVPPVDCEDAINDALALLAVPPGGESVLGGRLTDLYADIADAAPKALIIVTGYPLLFSPAPSDPDLAIKLQINAATAALNATIRQAVAVTNAAGANIVYVDVTGTLGFQGHGIGSAVPFINATGPDAFHPNAAGYRAYADVILAELDEQAQLAA